MAIGTDKAVITKEGGLAVNLTSKDDIYAGHILQVNTSNADSVECCTSETTICGVAYNAASDNDPVWVVKAGIAKCLVGDEVSITAGDKVYSSSRNNKVICNSTNGNPIGVALEDVTGSGGTTLCKVLLY